MNKLNIIKYIINFNDSFIWKKLLKIYYFQIQKFLNISVNKRGG